MQPDSLTCIVHTGNDLYVGAYISARSKPKMATIITPFLMQKTY